VQESGSVLVENNEFCCIYIYILLLHKESLSSQLIWSKLVTNKKCSLEYPIARENLMECLRTCTLEYKLLHACVCVFVSFVLVLPQSFLQFPNFSSQRRSPVTHFKVRGTS